MKSAKGAKGKMANPMQQKGQMANPMQQKGQMANPMQQKGQMANPMQQMLQRFKSAGIPKPMQEMFQKYMTDSSGGEDTTNWKGELGNALCKAMKANFTKGTVTYDTGEVVGPANELMYQSSVIVAGATYVGEPAPSKKKAEQSAAKYAVQDMFPEVGEQNSAPAWMAQMAEMFAAAPAQEAKQGGKKRKASEIEEDNSKVKFLHGFTILIGRSLTKADTEVTYQEEGGSFQAMLNIPEKGASFVGEVKESKKMAELSVFEQALQGMQAEFEPVLEAHQAKKKQKNQEALAKLKERTALKKAEKKAANDAAIP